MITLSSPPIISFPLLKTNPFPSKFFPAFMPFCCFVIRLFLTRWHSSETIHWSPRWTPVDKQLNTITAPFKNPSTFLGSSRRWLTADWFSLIQYQNWKTQLRWDHDCNTVSHPEDSILQTYFLALTFFPSLFSEVPWATERIVWITSTGLNAQL